MTTGAETANRFVLQSRQIDESEQRIKLALNAKQYDSDKLRDLLQKLDFVQLSIFSNWLRSEPGDIALSAQLFRYDAARLIYDYESGRYRKANEKERTQVHLEYPPDVKQPPEKKPRPKILDGRQIMQALEECVGD